MPPRTPQQSHIEDYILDFLDQFASMAFANDLASLGSDLQRLARKHSRDASDTTSCDERTAASC